MFFADNSLRCLMLLDVSHLPVFNPPNLILACIAFFGTNLIDNYKFGFMSNYGFLFLPHAPVTFPFYTTIPFR